MRWLIWALCIPVGLAIVWAIPGTQPGYVAMPIGVACSVGFGYLGKWLDE